MNRPLRSVWLVPLLWHVTLASAQQQTATLTAEPLLPYQSQRVFTGRYDPASRQGDVQAVHATRNAESPLWSASQLLQPRRAPSTQQPRHIVAGATMSLVDRLRTAPLGAILNANLWYVDGASARRPMVYAGAHDGMLHGFDAEEGIEHFAYAPRGLLQRLATSDATAAVDGPVYGGEARVGTDHERRPLLVAGLGAGGQGLVVLDIGAPHAFTADRVLVDLSDRNDADIGHISSPPVLEDGGANRARHIVSLQDGRPAVVFGNGHGSRDGRPVLLVQYLDRGRELARISPCPDAAPCAHAGDNGLSMPRLLDVDGDGRVDLAYAGDLHGNLWKFDLRGSESTWTVAFENRPFFTACDAAGVRQPITTAPYAAPHPRGGLMLVVGTGRQLQSSDSTNQGLQSIYGLHDDSFSGRTGTMQPARTPCSRPSALKPRAYGAGLLLSDVKYYSVVPTVSDAGADAAYRGWWIDLPVPGQRVLQNPRLFEGYKLLVPSVVPSGATGHPHTDGRAYLSVLNLITGDAPAQPAFAVVDDAVALLPIGMVSVSSTPALLQRLPGQRVQWRPASGAPLPLLTAPIRGARAGWRDRF